MLGTYEAIKQYKNKELLSMSFPIAPHSSPFPFGDHENRAPIPITTKKEGLDYHMELGGLRPACFALEEFNKIKKAQLQLKRVVRLWMKPQGYPPHNPCYCLYVVILEAVDAGGVVGLYQAHIQLHDLTEGMWLEAFYHCCYYEGMWLDAFGDHCCTYYQPVRNRLYHYLDNFYGSMFPKS